MKMSNVLGFITLCIVSLQISCAYGFTTTIKGSVPLATATTTVNNNNNNNNNSNRIIDDFSVDSNHRRKNGYIYNTQLKSIETDELVFDQSTNNDRELSARRKFLTQIPLLLTSTTLLPLPSMADDAMAVIESPAPVVVALPPPPPPPKPINTIEMKTFVDPKGLFVLNVPKRFFAIRRTVKGDLPDEATGKGRRGSSIFTAGDMSKAEVIAVERFPIKVLLEEEGIDASGDLSTFPNIGNGVAIANLIAVRRDRDKQTQARTIVIPNSVSVSEDGKTLYFSLAQSIEVQKPELLMEQMGVSELNRLTVAKATLNSNDGQLMAVFASALEQDFKAEDGPALQESVDTFVALSKSN